VNEIYKAIFDRVNSQTDYDCFDEIPQDWAVYPVIKIEPVDQDLLDMDDATDFDLTIQIISYSKYSGSKEILDIAKTIYTALHRWAATNTTTYAITNVKQVFDSTIAESKIRKNIQRYLITYEDL